MTKRNMLIISVILLPAVLALITKYSPLGKGAHGPTPLILLDLEGISNSIYLYFEIFNSYPQGDSAEIMVTLDKENILSGALHIKLDEKRGILDPWGTPYKIRISPNHEYEVRSAGPNGLFGDDDDKVSAGKFQYDKGVRGLKPSNGPNNPQTEADQTKQTKWQKKRY